MILTVSYISGKTELTIDERFRQHCYDSKKQHIEKRPLYQAMKKYGIENFHIELIEETDNPNERECYWIEYYGSFKNGYNATLGGDGVRYLDYDIIIATYLQLQNVQETAKRCGVSADHIYNILHAKNIKVKSSGEVAADKLSQVINQYDLDGNFIKSFPSIAQAARDLGKVTLTSRGAINHISEVCKGKRKTAYGYIWKYSN